MAVTEERVAVCAPVVGVAADAASIGASVVTTTVSAAGNVAGTAVRTVTGGSSSDEKKAH